MVFKVVIALLLFMHSGSLADTSCHLSSISHRQNTQLPTHLDRYQSERRDQVIQFSSHKSDQQVVALESLIHQLEAWETYDEQDQLLVMEDVRFILGSFDAEIQELRNDIAALSAEHSQQPFTYVGVEFPPDTTAEPFDQDHMNQALRARSLLVRTLSKHFTDTELDDLLLWYIGDEYYLRLPGNLLAGLPTHATEDAAVWEQYYQDMQSCNLGIMNAGFVMGGTASEPVIAEFAEWLGIGDPMDSATYLQIRSRLETALNQTMSSEDNRRKVEEMLVGCDSFTSMERDEAVAKILPTLPEGRGLIFRGALHRGPLTSALQQRCEPEAQTIGDGPEDQATD